MHHISSSVRKIIIAVCDLDLRESLAHYLHLQNYEVTSVGSALGLYKMIARESFAAAILDFALPDQDGLVITKYLRINTASRIILLATQPLVQDLVEGYSAGADLCLAKPFDLREIAAVVCNMVKRVDEHQARSLPKEAMHPCGSWVLVLEEWLLITPEGKKLHMTSKEYAFLNRLAEVPHGIVSRESLLKILGYEQNECGNRSLESLVYRLRKKIAMNLDTPIKAANGSGYSFAASIELFS